MEVDCISMMDAILRPNSGRGSLYNRCWTVFFFILWARSPNQQWMQFLLYSILDTIPILLTSLDAVSQVTALDVFILSLIRH